MIFNCEVTTTRDGVGVEWCEARATREWLGHQCGKGLIYCGIWLCLMALIAVMQKHSAMWFLLPIACFAAAKPVHWLAWRITGTPRAIYLKRSGAIESPHGLFGVSKVVGPWKTKIGDIANIEAEQIVFPKPDQDVDYTHGVRMILKSGRVFHVAGNLMPDHAHELAVSLSQAREAMRYDVSATSPRARSREAVY